MLKLDKNLSAIPFVIGPHLFERTMFVRFEDQQVYYSKLRVSIRSGWIYNAIEITFNDPDNLIKPYIKDHLKNFYG